MNDLRFPSLLKDLEGLRKAAAETLLIAAKDGRLEQALGGSKLRALVRFFVMPKEWFKLGRGGGCQGS